MGMVPGADVEAIRVAPLGDPVEYRVKGYALSMRRAEAGNIEVVPEEE
jgi:ferrous iron transport protein A